MVKNPPASAGDARDMGSIPGSGRILEKDSQLSLQYSCLENPMDRGAWQAIVLRAAKSWTLLNAITRNQNSDLKSVEFKEFPSGLVARIWHFHCRGLGSVPGQGTKILAAAAAKSL